GDHNGNVIESRPWPTPISESDVSAAAPTWRCGIRRPAWRGRPTSSGSARAAAAISGRRTRRLRAKRSSPLNRRPDMITSLAFLTPRFELDDDLDDEPEDDDDDFDEDDEEGGDEEGEDEDTETWQVAGVAR